MSVLVKNNKGGFTLPGESGYEDLTLQLAKKWGADVIRDSDGTELSPAITDAGYGIYSTICLIRSIQPWAKKHEEMSQQTFLCSEPVYADDSTVEVELLKGYFKEQLKINDSKESIDYWQVFDRTTEREIPKEFWNFDEKTGTVTIKEAIPFHQYTVNFLAFRIWEEISMYNHITNDWGDKEHLLQVDPIYPQVQEKLLEWLEEWCLSHPKTTVVRFTSLFYNFVWIWTDSNKRRDMFSDWASYDFTVSPLALNNFAKEYGYKLTSEDFINGGLRNSTHNAPTNKYLNWMEFVHSFVCDFGKKCVDLVHKYGKKAYVFYDDSWVGMEPYGEKFKDIGFDGLIKCVFNAYEARLCNGVDCVDTHEIRLHPYLFPTGLGGQPTFTEGGNPTEDAKKYWRNVRRALLRAPIDRIGLGGYLSLTQPFSDFQEYIAELSDEFRAIRELHKEAKPYTLPCKVGVLTAWGKLRSWSCSGHYHEHPELDLINVIEALAGLPIDVCFIGLEDVAKNGIPDDVDVVINAGLADTAWSGGFYWNDERVIENLISFVSNGGGFIGINEPSFYKKGLSNLRMSDVLGVDLDKGTRICETKRAFDVESGFVKESEAEYILPKDSVFLINDYAKVLLEYNGVPAVVENDFGKGKGMYFSGFRYSPESARLLLKSVLRVAQKEYLRTNYLSDNPNIDCAYFDSAKKIIVANSSAESQRSSISILGKEKIDITLEAYESRIISV